MIDIGKVTKKVEAALAGTSNALVKAIGAPQAPKPKLTPQQQVDRFLRLKPADLDILRSRFGDEQFDRYLERMKQYAEVK